MSKLQRLVPWISLAGLALALGSAFHRSNQRPMILIVAFSLAGLFILSGISIEYWDSIRRMRVRIPWLLLPYAHDNMPEDSLSDLEIAHKEIHDSFDEFEGYFLELKALKQADETANTMARQRDQRFSLTERTPRAARRDMERQFLRARRNLYEALADFKTVLFWRRKS